jgi:beta-phosphoglucomutase-like phosphatase (HAD superfamily)
LIFDLDGVIVDSNPIHSKIWRVYLRRHGIEAPGDFDQKMFGRRNDEIVRKVFGADLDPAEVLRRGAAKEALYREVMGPVLKEHLVPKGTKRSGNGDPVSARPNQSSDAGERTGNGRLLR